MIRTWQTIDFREDWAFHLGDVPHPELAGPTDPGGAVQPVVFG